MGRPWGTAPKWQEDLIHRLMVITRARGGFCGMMGSADSGGTQPLLNTNSTRVQLRDRKR